MVNQLLEQALTLHRQGRLDEAELCYRRLLDQQPEHGDALHLLGVLAYQRGDYAQAVHWLAQAAQRLPTAAIVFSNWSEAARLRGDLSTAVEAAQRAVQLDPALPEAHNHLGLAWQAAGQPDQAEAAFRQAVTLRPDFALAWNNLGTLLRQQQRDAEALAAFRQAVAADPQLPLALSNLGQALLETQGDKSEAERLLRQAVEQAPSFAEAWSNLGNALRAQDKLEEAIACYRRALQLRPDLAMIHGNLGQALQQQGHLAEAIRCYAQAAHLDPASPRFETFWASALAELEDYTAAAEHYRKALALKPDHVEALQGLGNVLLEQGEFDQALEHFQAALRLRPTDAETLVSRAAAYAELGQLEQAQADYRAALQHDPEHAGAWSVLATQLRDRLPDEDVAAMEALVARSHLSDWRRALLHHGLAHVYDARGDYVRAAEHAARGNAHRLLVWQRQGKTYRRDEHSAFVDFLIRCFSPEWFRRTRGWGLETSAPVFIVGMPRSGTTLIEQILASHPQVYGGGELTITKDVIDLLPAWLGRQEAAPLCLPWLTRPVALQAAKEHLARLRRRHPGAARLVDKMPDNYLWLGWLVTLFPQGRFIHVRRDDRDVALSCWLTNFKQIRWACDLDDIAARLRDHHRIMAHWRAVLPVPLLEVNYEDVVQDLETATRQLLDFCGLDWHPDCLRFHQTQRPVRTASLAQVRQPVYRHAVQRWRRYLDTPLGPFLRQLADEASYPPEHQPTSTPSSLSSTLLPSDGEGIVSAKTNDQR
ncbi:MAG: tetratricopeptide repeat protein [Gemmataceae bacterium]|nr:tetratricopeptide repeat protein [Gemmataceae bacterium]